MKISVTKLPFSSLYKNYCGEILKVCPEQDLLGIDEIIFTTKFSHPKSDPKALACYLEVGSKQRSTIEVNTENLAKENIPNYLWNFNKEIAGLFLSEIIFHEIGHHVHRFKRHGIKQNQKETFASRYAEAGYHNYLESRKNKILWSYTLASLNFIAHDKDGRRMFKENKRELIEWLEKHESGLPFP